MQVELFCALHKGLANVLNCPIFISFSFHIVQCYVSHKFAICYSFKNSLWNNGFKLWIHWKCCCLNSGFIIRNFFFSFRFFNFPSSKSSMTFLMLAPILLVKMQLEKNVLTMVPWDILQCIKNDCHYSLDWTGILDWGFFILCIFKFYLLRRLPVVEAA